MVFGLVLLSHGRFYAMRTKLEQFERDSLSRIAPANDSVYTAETRSYAFSAVSPMPQDVYDSPFYKTRRFLPRSSDDNQ